MNRRVLLFVVFALCLFFAGVMGVSAAEPGAPEQIFEIQLEVDKDGNWAVPSFGGLDLGISNKTIGALMDLLGLQVQMPVIDPALIQTAQKSNIQNIALVKEGARTTILVNNEPLTALTLSDEALALVERFTPNLEEMVAGLQRSNIAIGIRLPDAPPVDLSARLEPVEEAAEPLNQLELGATISPEGQLVSVAGLAPAQLGFAAPQLDISILEQLGIEGLTAQVSGTGVALETNGKPFAALEWNVPALKKVPDIYASATGVALTPVVEQGMDVAFDWLENSTISVSASIAETPQESLPQVDLGRPLVVEITDDNRLAIEGFVIQTGLEPTIAQVRDRIQSVALAWDGPNGRLSTMANGKPLPAVRMDKDLLNTALNTFVGGPTDWDKIVDLASNVNLTVAATASGAPVPDLAALEYEPQPGPRLVSIMPKLAVSSSEGSVAVFNEKLPLKTIESLAGVAITDPLKQIASAYPDIESIKFTMAPNGIELALNDQYAFVEWDDQLRNNLVDTVAGVVFGDADATVMTISETSPAATVVPEPLRDVRVSMLKGLIGVLNQMEIGLEVQVQEEPIPAGVLATLVDGLGGLLLTP